MYLSKKQRIFVYSLGALAGCAIASVILKDTFSKKETTSVVMHGKVVPGQDMRAKKPMPPEFSLEFKELSAGNPGSIQRNLLLKDQHKNNYLRIEETLTKDEQGREQLVLRRQMIADQLLVRLKSPRISTEKLTSVLDDAGCYVGGPGKRSGLYYVKLRETSLEAMDRAIEKLQAQSDVVDKAMPVYITSRL